jgi:peptide/nickel transport system substrate-binding protein
VAPAESVEFRILGPFEVVSDGRLLPLGPGQERVLLAVLLLHRNERVSTTRMTDLLWDESPPESAPKMVQIYVSRLRRRLATATNTDRRLVTEAAGYRLRVEKDELDLERFERLRREGRAALSGGDPALAAARLRQALSLWRGTPLADIGDGRFLEQERARLEELRLGALEERIDADLALGAGAALVDELQALVREHPLRERSAARLMLALYRSGRQADALASYKVARDRLVDELGIEPGRPLKELEQAILVQDRALDAQARERMFHAGEIALPRPRRRRLARRQVAAAAAAVIAIGAAVGVAIALSGNGRGQIRLAANAVGLVRDGRIVDETRVGAAPAAIAGAGEEFWVASTGANAVSRLDPETLDIRQTIPVGNGPSGIALGRGAVWVANGLDGTVSRIDPKANKVVQTIQVGNGPAAIAYGLGSVWVANRVDQTVSRIDPRTGDVLDTLAAGTDAAAIAAGVGAVWVVDQTRGRVARLEPGFTEPALTINVGNGPSAIALGAGSLWVANTLDSTVMRIDPRSARVVATIPVGAGPSSLAVARDGTWVGNQLDGTLWRIDPKRNLVDRKTRLGQRPEAIAGARSGVLVAAGPSAASHRGGTLRLAASEFPYGSIDPLNLDWPAVILTNDGLTGFRRVGGVEGTQLVPDLAVGLPTPTNGGTTYTFRLRHGIRYSDGRPVRAEDIRRALKRSLIISRDAYYMGAIVGATECAARPSDCDLSRGIAVDERTSTVTFHLKAPDPDFLFKLALPFAYALPAGTSNRDVRTHPVPATGPYMITAYKPRRSVTLSRNPRFHVWSAAAQPAGYPDRIVWRLDVSPAAQVAAVESRKTDVAFDGVPPGRLAEVTTQYASQVRENPIPRTTFAFLNTRVPPFDDTRVRRAVSYAADRAAFVRALGGPDRAQPTCQVLPLNFPGYRPYCPFTLGPGSAGAWSRPDLRKARRLVAASGTRGAAVTVWIPANRRPEGGTLVMLLRQLGYRARPKQLDTDSYNARIGDPRLRIQAGVLSWQADFPAASNFIAFFFKCPRHATGANTNPSQFCDPSVDKQIRRALALEATDPALAASLWSQLDREIVDQAPMVPLVNPKQVDFLSSRVGNYQYNPQWGLLLDELWVR